MASEGDRRELLKAHAHAADVPDEQLRHRRGRRKSRTNAYIAGSEEDVGADIFARVLDAQFAICPTEEHKVDESITSELRLQNRQHRENYI